MRDSTTTSSDSAPDATRRVVAFVDGQNLFRSALDAFGPTHQVPRYDALRLAERVTRDARLGCLTDVYFYTGVHTAAVKPALAEFWRRKLDAMSRQVGESGARMHVWSAPLRYTQIQSPESARLTPPHAHPTHADPAPRATPWHVGHEKGVDVRIAVDLVRTVRRDRPQSVLLFSQDTDLALAVAEATAVAAERGEPLHCVTAYPAGGQHPARQRAIPGTRALPLSQALYEQCLDPNDYWPRVPTRESPERPLPPPRRRMR